MLQQNYSNSLFLISLLINYVKIGSVAKELTPEEAHHLVDQIFYIETQLGTLFDELEQVWKEKRQYLTSRVSLLRKLGRAIHTYCGVLDQLIEDNKNLIPLLGPKAHQDTSQDAPNGINWIKRVRQLHQEHLKTLQNLQISTKSIETGSVVSDLEYQYLLMAEKGGEE